MTSICFAGVVVMALLSIVNGYQYFQARIPNGNTVPNPCDLSSIWAGVGHQNPLGGGPRNPFGLDFAANNFVWNQTICEKDSDGDGLKNGYELGDPNCTFAEGGTPARNYSLTHPGVCEPLGSSTCTQMNTWMTNCNDTKFNCPAATASDVKNITLRFPQTDVPTDDTTYICNRYFFPNDTTSDIIAFEQVIDNINIVHHMVVFGCESTPPGNLTSGPYICKVGAVAPCTALLQVWTVGSTGQCLNNQYGIRIGPGAFQHAVLQIHWNNIQRKSNLTDSSGLKIYYTTALRPNSGEVFMTGQSYLEIPPGRDNITVNGNCSTSCSSQLPHSLFVVSMFLHMHLLGVGGSVGIYRNGKLVTFLMNIDHYDFNLPATVTFDTPIEVKPGDVVVMKCVFNPKGKNTTTYYGQSTSVNEMCWAFISYYPRVPGFMACSQWKTIDICTDKQIMYSDACDLNTYMNYLAVLPVFCSANCSNASCIANVRGALSLGCQRDQDIMSLLQGSLPNQLSLLAYCSLTLPPSDQCGTPGIGLSMATTPSHCPALQSIPSGAVSLLSLTVLSLRHFG